MRAYFGTRYDSRANMYDWDYTFRLRPVCSGIHSQHYRRWRESGQAYEVRYVLSITPTEIHYSLFTELAVLGMLFNHRLTTFLHISLTFLTFSFPLYYHFMNNFHMIIMIVRSISMKQT